VNCFFNNSSSQVAPADVLKSKNSRSDDPEIQLSWRFNLVLERAVSLARFAFASISEFFALTRKVAAIFFDALFPVPRFRLRVAFAELLQLREPIVLARVCG